MKHKKAILLVFATILMLVLAGVAVITSLRLQELSTVPVTPNVPVSQPRADTYVCQTSFTVTEEESGVVRCIAKKAYADDARNTPGNYYLESALESGSQVSANTVLVYVVDISNTDTVAKTATIKDVLPAGLEFVDATSPCTYATTNRTVTCTDVSVPVGSTQWGIRVRVLSTATVGELMNSAVVTPSAGEESTCAIGLTVVQVNTELACVSKDAYKTSVSAGNKLAAGAEVAPGDTIVYQVNYSNTGDAAGTITITDVLSNKLEFVSAETPCTYAAATRTVTCSNVSVAAGASGSKQITVKVLAAATAGEIGNTATVTPSGGTPSNCAIAVNVVVTTSELACVSKDAYKTSVSAGNKLTATGAEVAPGDTIIYQVNYRNSGDAAGTITIIDVLSNKLEFVSAETPCTYAAATRTVTCSNVSVAAGASGSKQITVKVLAAATAGEIGNTAKVVPSEGEETLCEIKIAVKIPPEAPVCNDYCANNSECPSGLVCSWNKCRNASCLDDNDCVCEQPPGCDEPCNPDNYENECDGGYVCDRESKSCRNSACMSETDCTCAVQGDRVAPRETLPQAGSPLPGFIFLAAGALLLILGVLVVGL